MSYKKNISLRTNIVFALLCMMAVGIFAKTIHIQRNADKWHDLGIKTSRIDTVEGNRGNIYSDNGRLLATTLPFYEIHFDPTVVHDTIYQNELDTLAGTLSTYFRDRSKEAYVEYLNEARKTGDRYLEISKKVDFKDLQSIKKWPIFKYGQYRGGLIAEVSKSRVMPFKKLAQRTVGLYRPKIASVGLEGSFNDYLKGTTIPRYVQKLPSGSWVPVFDNFGHEAENGKDVYTTIDINLQDVVENALDKCVRRYGADHGCAIVMETVTGKIKAIANLEMGNDSIYWEKFNHAVGTGSEHGSTFKVASLTALLEDGYVTDTTIVNIEEGNKAFSDEIMRDAAWYPESEISVAKMMQILSNVGIAKLIDQYYGKQPEKWVGKLNEMHLTQPTGIEIDGEPIPELIKPSDEEWNNITVPWMAIGYNIKLTPLQMLTFFNAIANDGKMMKPYLVSEVKDMDRSVRRYFPRVLQKRVCKPEVAKTVRKILRGVVEGGTAKNIKTDQFSIAGKTGTAKIAKRNKKGYYKKYQASFVGCFPAENPVYSCIVVINNPKGSNYYGGTVAAPVFKEIAEKCYAKTLQLQTPINTNDQYASAANSHMPPAKNGYQKDLTTIYHMLGVSNIPSEQSEWVVPKPVNNAVALKEINFVDNLVPNVEGMGLRDALYVLENKGLNVKFSGRGKIYRQAPKYGARYRKGDVVRLELR